MGFISPALIAKIEADKAKAAADKAVADKAASDASDRARGGGGVNAFLRIKGRANLTPVNQAPVMSPMEAGAFQGGLIREQMQSRGREDRPLSSYRRETPPRR